MDTGIRLLGGSTSLIVNALFLMLLVQAAPGPYCQENCFHATYFSLNNGIGDLSAENLQRHNGHSYDNQSIEWMPYIDIPESTGSSHQLTSDNAPSCRVNPRNPAPKLIEAPVPKGLPRIVRSLWSTKNAGLFLCVQVDRDGRARREYLPRSTGDAFRDEHLIDLVATKWRFEVPRVAATPIWVRIRLDKTEADLPSPIDLGPAQFFSR